MAPPVRYIEKTHDYYRRSGYPKPYKYALPSSGSCPSKVLAQLRADQVEAAVLVPV